MSEPRLPPLTIETAEGESKAQLERAEARGGPVLNITRTLAHYPELSSAWGRFARHVLGESSLPARDREIVILRMGWNCRSGYEFGQHRRIGQQAGLSLDEVERVKSGPDHESWSTHEAALLRAADELHADAFITDATWSALAERYDTKQMMDVVFAAGQYNLVSMALNTLGVQLEPGTPGLELE
ncbi:MAG: carboxymuconolactone decarboxylase family protein [Chloroflexi bacterium]|nr:carboxymuconolactone decarboxylase family protein [Chloroflexota bacterium]